MGITRRAFLAAGSAFGAVALHELTDPGRSRAQEQLVVNLYSARHYPSDTQLYERFLKQTGIKVNLLEAKAETLIERVKSEGANSPADVIMTVDAGNLWQAEQAGLLQAIESKLLTTKIPASLRSGSGSWYGFTKRARVIVYNKAQFSPTDIGSYEDLAAPNMRGKILVRSSGNIYNQSLVGAILAARGEADTEAWAKAVVQNFARKPEGNDTAQIKAVAAGLGDVAVVNTYYLARLIRSKDKQDQEIAAKVGVIFPNQKGPYDRGTHVNISGGGVAKNAPHKDAAIKFLEYLTTTEAQGIFAESNNEYPVVAGASKSSAVQSFGLFKEDKLSAEVFAANNQKALQIMDRAGWK